MTRRDRITNVLAELQREIAAGFDANEINAVSFWFYVPSDGNAVTFCQFRTETVPAFDLCLADLQPRLRIESNAPAARPEPHAAKQPATA